MSKSSDEQPSTSSARGLPRAVRWFAAEFLVVVTGVVIALALSSIYQRWQDRNRETEYLRQLVADLRETERLMNGADSINAPFDRSTTLLLRSFRGGEIPARDSLLRWTVDLQFDSPVPVLGTADALVETGDLQLIRDLDLRSELISYVSRSREYNIPWMAMVENDFVVARKQFRVRVDVLEAESIAGAGTSGSVPPDASSDLYEVGDENPYPLDLARLRHDREVYFSLVAMVLAKRQQELVRDVFRTEARTLRHRLQEALAT